MGHSREQGGCADGRVILEEHLAEVAHELLTLADRPTAGAAALRVERLAGGANNRVYRVDGVGDSGGPGGPWVLKCYFRHPGDPRDRLRGEFEFLRYTWSAGVRCTPEPIEADPRKGVALYSFVEGRKLEPGEIDGEAVKQAVDFFRAINAPRGTQAAKKLGAASEACFSLAQHLATVERRVEGLTEVAGDSPVERDAAEFIRGALTPTWRDVEARAIREAQRMDWSLHDELPAEARRISPSDFGFHNALRMEKGTGYGVQGTGEKTGRAIFDRPLNGDCAVPRTPYPVPSLCFLDFEYAGWDDPAKTVCDFFCQVQKPVPMTHWDGFASGVLPEDNAAFHRARAELLLPVYRVKWCCILLGQFLPGPARERRQFAAGSQEQHEAALRTQLLKAHAMLRLIDRQSDATEGGKGI
ncbi:MAG: phosphotransferase [Phycisphaeraceae bacterium]|nr:phosphotransferase [Phycisphaeraceae bacterium]